VPALPDRASGLRLTAAIYKSDVTDPVNFVANPPHFVAHQLITQSVANSTATAIVWDVVDVDSYSGFSAGVYTAQVAGWYSVDYYVCWANNVTGHRATYLQKNGSDVVGSWRSSTPSSSYPTSGGTYRIQLDHLDSVQVLGQQSSGGALLTASPGVGTSWWSIRWDHA
jgi:hypothetical protein